MPFGESEFGASSFGASGAGTGSGTGTLPLLGRRLLGRVVDYVNGKKVFGVACGTDTCSGGRLWGREVAVKNGKKVFGVTSECCQPPIDPASDPDLDLACWDEARYQEALSAEEFFVEKTRLPPYGLSRILRVRVQFATKCPTLSCKIGYLFYVDTAPTGSGTGTGTGTAPECSPPGDRGYWEGCVAGADFLVWVDSTDPLVMAVCINGCVIKVDRNIDLTSPEGCFKIDGTVNDVGGGEDCCECPNPLYDFSVVSFCGPRRLGRLIGVVRGDDGIFRKVYGIGDCCDERDPCTPGPCCGREGPFPTTMYATVLGVGTCGGAGTTVPINWTCDYTEIVGLPNSSPGVWVSDVFTFNINTCVVSMQILLVGCSSIAAGFEHFATGGTYSECPTDDPLSLCGVGEEAWNMYVAFSISGDDHNCFCGTRFNPVDAWCRSCLDLADPDFSCNPVLMSTQFQASIESPVDPDTGEPDCPPENVCDFLITITEEEP